MLRQLWKKFASAAESKSIPNLGYVGADDDWYAVEINREFICHECVGDEDEPPKQEAIYLGDNIEEILERIDREHEEEERAQDAEYEFIESEDDSEYEIL